MDDGALAAIPVIVAGVLVLSGILKVGQTRQTAASMVDLGVPFARQLRRFAGWLPWVELVLAVALLVLPGAGLLVAGAVVAVFFLVLTVIVARAAARPGEVHCNCFGATKSEPVGWRTVLRNAVLTAAAVLIASGATGTAGVIPAIVGFDRQSVTWLVTILIAAGVFALLWWSNQSLAARLAEVEADVEADDEGGSGGGVNGRGNGSGVGVGGGRGGAARDRQSGQSALPGVQDAPLDVASEELVTADGILSTVRELADAPQLVVFVQLDCHACSTVVAELPGWADALAPSVMARVATSVKADEFAEAYPAVATTALYGTRGLRLALGITMVPAAVLIGRDSHIAAGPVYGHEEIERLVGGIAEALLQNG